MDAQARKKALFRAKLNAQNKEKRIDSPLVRYNELDQPICRVCDVVLKSESLWDAHQASRKHHEAISNIKAKSAGVSRAGNAKRERSTELPISKSERSLELHDTPEPSTELPKPQKSSGLPPGFFDSKETKRSKNERDSAELVDPVSHGTVGGSYHTQAKESLNAQNDLDGLPSGNVVQSKKNLPNGDSSEIKQVKGALPEGFFDNKDADLLARGIKPVKPDVKDEYKEFEKLIQEDLKEVDDRLEEEEFDAAEMIEEAESVEQKTYWEKLEMLQKKKMELKLARSAKNSSVSGVSKEPNHEESNSDDDSDDNFAVDWRAQHL